MMYKNNDMIAGSDRGYEMQLDKLLYSGSNQKQQFDKSSANKKDEVSTVEHKTSTVKYWKNVKTEY